MVAPGEPLSIVEEWKKKSLEISSESNDSFVSLLSKGIEAMAVILNKESPQNNVVRALAYLEFERTLSLQLDNNKNDVVRSLWYGTIESLHFTLSELSKERNKVKECGEMFTQTEESSPLVALNDYAHYDFDQSLDNQSIMPNLLISSNEEPFDHTAIKIEDLCGDVMEIKNEEMFNDEMDTQNADGDIAGNVLNAVNNIGRAQFEVPELNMRDDFSGENDEVYATMKDAMADEMMEEEDITENNEDGIDQDKKDSGTVEVKKKTGSSRMIVKLVKYNESLDDSDGDSEPSMKKQKLESTKMKKKKASSAIKKKGGTDSMKSSMKKGEGKINGSELECPECEYRGKTTQALIRHLRCKHSTTLALAGLALRCDCGVESLSEKHSLKCDIANFTVVRKREGPIQRFTDEKKPSVQCILCAIYPKSLSGYNQHLHIHHKTTLISEGIYLLCACGTKYRSKHSDSKHTEECNHREFTLHKYADE